MQIIDWDRRGNLVRFFLGENGKQYGDDWNDAPYDGNAGSVYSEFVRGHRDVVFPYDFEVLEPRDGVLNCAFTKEDMRDRAIPCLLVIPPDVTIGWRARETFSHAIAVEGVVRFYFGDEMEPSDKIEIFAF